MTPQFPITETLENERIIQLTSNNRVFLRREDPYGFWYISFEKGQMPQHLKQAFTSVDEAMKKLTPYLLSKNKEAVKV